MTTWSFQILRQQGFDWWMLVCILASLVLLFYAVLGRLWTRPVGLLALPLAAMGIAGTIVVLAIPAFHTPLIGMAWTFAVVSLLSAVFYLNLRDKLSTVKMSTLLGMRVVGLVLMVPMLFEPVIRYVTTPKPERPLLIAVDASGSMSVPDIQNGPTRMQSVWQTLRPLGPMVNEKFVPRYFVFATETRELKKPDELATLPADGKATDLVRAVREVAAQAKRDDAIIVLISDGIDNVSSDVVGAIAAVRRPVHGVLVGTSQAKPSVANVEVANIETTDDFVVDHESKVKIVVKSTALDNRVVDVRLSELDAQGKPTGKLASKTLVLQNLPEGQGVELNFKPRTVGVQKLAAWIDPIAGERTTVDNRQEFQGLALDPRIKVLYVEGRARPEYTQLNRALQRDPNIELASLLRITDDRFASSGSINGEKVERIPVSKEELARFDVLIIGDMDSSFLTRLQQSAVEQYVLGGGGLLMIGGQNAFGPGNYKDSAVEKALPVFVGDTSSPQEKTQFVPTLAPDGATHPAMEGLADWFNITAGAATQPAKRQLLPLKGNVVVGKPKSAASVLLTHHGRPGLDGQPQVILAVQRYGEGRSAAFTADTTYVWYLQMRGMGQESPYNRFWGQLVRWLAAEDVRNRSRGAGVEGLLNKSVFQLGDDVRVRAMVRDERGDATQFANVNLILKPVGGKPSDAKQLPLNPVETRRGLYDVTIPNPDKGDWTIELVASKDGKELGRQPLKFTVIPPAEEFVKLAAQPEQMRQIATSTRGFFKELRDLRELLETLAATQGDVARRERTVPLANTPRALLALAGIDVRWEAKFDLPMQAALVVLLLAAEWMLRRQWQLP